MKKMYISTHILNMQLNLGFQEFFDGFCIPFQPGYVAADRLKRLHYGAFCAWGLVIFEEAFNFLRHLFTGKVLRDELNETSQQETSLISVHELSPVILEELPC